jgi:hypothetical protein
MLPVGVKGPLRNVRGRICSLMRTDRMKGSNGEDHLILYAIPLRPHKPGSKQWQFATYVPMSSSRYSNEISPPRRQSLTPTICVAGAPSFSK